ncbi:MAG: hypothetical protein ACOVP4_06445 [Bacteriovoracaceae bacterium]
MKLALTLIFTTFSLMAVATEAETPCPAMNQETREKIVDFKQKASEKKTNQVIKQ